MRVQLRLQSCIRQFTSPVSGNVFVVVVSRRFVLVKLPNIVDLVLLSARKSATFWHRVRKQPVRHVDVELFLSVLFCIGVPCRISILHTDLQFTVGVFGRRWWLQWI